VDHEVECVVSFINWVKACLIYLRGEGHFSLCKSNVEGGIFG